MIETQWRCPACEFDNNPEGYAFCVRCSCPQESDEEVIAEHQRQFNHGRAAHERAGFVCVKCGGHEKEVAALRASGGPMSSILNTSTRKFYFISCVACGYTEFYRTSIGVADFAEDLLRGRPGIRRSGGDT